MAIAAKHITGEGELPGFIWREANRAGFTCLDARADFEIGQAEAVLYIFGLDFKHHRLALFYGDLAGSELKFFRCNMDYFFSRLCGCYGGNAAGCSANCQGNQ